MDLSQVLGELRELRLQIHSDFDFNVLAFKDMALSHKVLAEQIARHNAETSERLTQVEGRMRLQEKRFDSMLGKVENALQLVSDNTLELYQSLERRVEVLEKERHSPPAA